MALGSQTKWNTSSYNLADLYSQPQSGLIFEGTVSGGGAGQTVALAGDLNRDDNPDLAIGAPLALNNAGEAYVVFGSKNAYQNLRPGQNVFSLDPTLTDTRDDDQAQTFNLSAAEGDLFLLDSLTFGALSFQGNQISLGAELLAIVVDYTGNPVTDLGANPQWFVSI